MFLVITKIFESMLLPSKIIVRFPKLKVNDKRNVLY